MSITKKEKEIFTLAITKWGLSSQISALIEEFGETIQRAAQLQNKKTDVVNFLEELADAEIMIDQMRLYFGNERMDRWREQKMNRLEKRLKNG